MVEGTARCGRRRRGDAAFTVVTAGDGEEALEVARRAGRPLDLVVTDVVMPRLDGPSAVRRLREASPALKVLFTSGYTDRRLEDLGATTANSAFIGKPFRPHELVALALALLERPAATS